MTHRYGRANMVCHRHEASLDTPYISGQLSSEFRSYVVHLHPPLFESVPIPNRHRLVLHRLAIDGDAVGRARFVLPAVAAADGSLFVVEDVPAFLELAVDLLSDFGHAVLLHQRENGG